MVGSAGTTDGGGERTGAEEKSSEGAEIYEGKEDNARVHLRLTSPHPRAH